MRAQTPSDIRSAAPPTRSAVLHSVEISVAAGESTITLEADGPLPVAHVGVLEGPPRLFIDLPGILPKTSPAIDPGDPIVRRVRIAVHSTRPLITRVVVDLAQMVPFRLLTAERASGRFVLVLGGPEPLPLPSPSNALVSLGPDASDLVGFPLNAQKGTTGAASPSAAVPVGESSSKIPASSRLPPGLIGTGARAPGVDPPVVRPPQPIQGNGAATRRADVPPPPSANVPPSPPANVPPSPPANVPPPPSANVPPPPSANVPPSPPANVPPSSPPETGRYASDVSAVLDSLERLRPLLTSIDRMRMVSLQDLTEAVRAIEEIRRRLSRIEAPARMQSVHSLLGSACGLAATAVRTRTGASTNDDETARNAASAAAGSLLLLDQIRLQLGHPPDLAGS